jgi:protoporphyrinogen oxidase
MTLALRMAQSGRQVTLFESASSLGGLASAWSLGDVVWDRHYHVMLASDRSLCGLLTELGLNDEVRWMETKTGFYSVGRLHSMSNALEFLHFPVLNIVDKFRLATTVLYASRLKDWKKLEGISATAWLERCAGRRTLEKIWLPLLRAKLGENYSKASAAFIWAVIARMYSARKEGLKKEMFGYVPGGYARILQCYGERLQNRGVKVQLDSTLERVVSLEGGGGVEAHLRGGRCERFDHVVLTMAAPIAERICCGLTERERQQLRQIEYQGILCASLLLEQPLADYYITNITEDWVPFTAVIEMSALVGRHQFGGKTLIYLPRYVPASSADFEWSDEEIQQRFLAALERMYPRFRRSHVLAFRLSRVRYVLPIPTLGYSRRLPPMTTSMPAVHIVNSAHIVNGTLNVDETVQLAERAARQFQQIPVTAAGAETTDVVH